MMKNMKYLWVIALIGIATNCQQNGQEIVPDMGTPAEYTTARDQVAVNFAKNLAFALKQPNVRKFIKEQTIEQFDGDYNFLFGTHKDKQISVESTNGRISEMSFKDILFGQASANNSRASGSSFLDSLAEMYPLLQIAIPELANASAENWDANNEIPLIAVIPRSTKGLEFILAYDSDGNVFQLPVDEEPTEAIIVISENERLIGVDINTNGRYDGICPLSQEPYYSTPSTNYYFLNDYYQAQNDCQIGNPPSTGTPPNAGTPACDRDNKDTKDELVKMIVNTYEQFKRINDWWDSGQEFVATIIMAEANGNITQLQKLVTGKDGDFRDCPWFNCTTIWRNSGVEIVTWDESIYGDTMIYDWIERDSGDSKEVSVTITTKINGTSVTATAKRTITDEDDILGSSAVEYCDKADGSGYKYNTGIISFYVKQR